MASAPPRSRPLPELATELRTALTPVLGYLELLVEDQRIGDQELRWLASIERQLHSIGRLSEELIAFCEEQRAVIAAIEGEGDQKPG